MIETKRLILKPLTYDQLIKYIKCDNSLEEELNLNRTSRIISPELKEAFEQTILPECRGQKQGLPVFNTLDRYRENGKQNDRRSVYRWRTQCGWGN